MINNEGKIIGTTESLCPHCLQKLTAHKVLRGQAVYLEKTCPEHGFFQVILWRGLPEYQSWSRPKIPSTPKVCFTEVDKGCPFDCGLCADHRQHTCTALLEVTFRCNLNCTFCFADASPSQQNDPDLTVIKGWYQRLLDAGGPYNVQISGGEPTVREDLVQIVAIGRQMGFNFIQLNTNGIRLADKNYVKELREAGLASVFLQFDGTKDDIYQALRGRNLLAQKITAIENCIAENIGVVLVPTLVPGVNTDNIGDIIRFAIEYAPGIRGVHFQPVSYFGRYPEPPKDEQRITIPEVINSICEQTAGMTESDNFLPPGCENALCSFHGNFVIMPDSKLMCWSKNKTSCCSNNIEVAAEGSRKSRQFVSKYWSAPEVKITKEIDFGGWGVFLQRIKTHSFTISGMAFQDVWNIDLERVRDCCIHIVSPKGNIVPFCAYNLTDSNGNSLYRGKQNEDNSAGQLDSKKDRV
jgi:hypothetical protein